MDSRLLFLPDVAQFARPSRRLLLSARADPRTGLGFWSEVAQHEVVPSETETDRKTDSRKSIPFNMLRDAFQTDGQNIYNQTDRQNRTLPGTAPLETVKSPDRPKNAGAFNCISTATLGRMALERVIGTACEQTLLRPRDRSRRLGDLEGNRVKTLETPDRASPLGLRSVPK